MDTNTAANKTKNHNQNRFENVRPVAHSKVQAPSRLILSNKVITLQAFANGKKLKPPKSMAFDEKALKSWRVILETLTDKLEMDKACVKLYTADSYALVTTPDQLEHQGKYICVGAGEKLKKHSYGREPPKFNSSKHVRKHELAPIKRSRRPHPEGGESYNTTTESSPISTSTAKTTSTKKSTPIRKSTKPKKEEDGVFHARPVKHTPSGGARLDEEIVKAETPEQEDKAATTIQAGFRGYKTRQGLKEALGEDDPVISADDAPTFDEPAAVESPAAPAEAPAEEAAGDESQDT